MRTYVDVTQLMQWQGRLTGVPRVQYELISRFAKDADTVLLYWHGFDFAKIDAAEVFATRPAVVTPTNETSSLQTIMQQAKAKLSQIEVAKRAYHKLKSMTEVTPSTTNVEIIRPSEGETLVVLEGIWRDEHYIAALQTAVADGAHLVQVSYDMLPLVTPQYSGHSTEALETYVKNIYPIASKILSISEHTKKDITRWLKSQDLPVPPIDVFRLGEDFKRTKEIAPAGIGAIEDNYILCVGTIEARKNHTLLYYLYKHAAQHSIKLPPLVIVGRKGWRAADTYDLLTTDPDVCDAVTILENTSDEELAWLYAHAKFTMYPSFYEGWGLPIAESVMHGTPCLCSNTSSMPEVAGALADYFDPTSMTDALAKVRSYMDDSTLQQKRAALAGYTRTSWDTCYEEVKRYIMELT